MIFPTGLRSLPNFLWRRVSETVAKPKNVVSELVEARRAGRDRPGREAGIGQVQKKERRRSCVQYQAIFLNLESTFFHRAPSA